MAKTRYFVTFKDSAGAMKAGLSPVWASLYNVGTPPAVPAAIATPDTAVPIVEAGGGIYYFDYDTDANGHLVGVVDGTAGATGTRYEPVETSLLAQAAVNAALTRMYLFNEMVLPADGDGTQTLTYDSGVKTSWNLEVNGGTRTRTKV